MKRYSILFITVLAAVVLAGCNAREDMPAPISDGIRESVFSASSEIASKAYVDGLSVLWDAGDELGLYDNVGSEKAVFTLQSGAGTKNATFKGVVSSAATRFFAAYPAASLSAAGDSILTIAVPSSQRLVEGGRNLDPAALIGVAATTGSDLAFKNVISAIRFTIDMDNIVSVSLKGNNGENVAGTVTVDAVTGTIGEVVEGAQEVVLAPSGEVFAKGQYVFSLLPGQFTGGLTLCFTDKAGNVTERKNTSNLVIARNRLLDLAAFIMLYDSELTFNPGETKEIRVLSQGVSGLAAQGVPEGWTVDASAVGSGILKITAPAAGAAVSAGSFDLRGTSATSAAVSSDALTVRLYGINNKAEFLAFRSLYQGDDPNDNTRLNSPVTDPGVIGKYLVDGALSLNSDLSFNTDDMVLKAYMLKYLNVPLEGNGHTITVDFAGTVGVCALFQYLGADVRNLNIAGSAGIAYSGDGRIASLATLTTNTTVEVKNVHSSVNLASTSKVLDLGGILAYANQGTVTLDGCSYSGTVAYAPLELSAAPALGGLVGRTNATSLTIKSSVSEGAFNISLDNRKLCGAENSGVGGIIGVTLAEKEVALNAVTNKTAIVVTGVNKNEDRTHFAQIIGSNLSGADISSCTEDGSVSFEDYVGPAVVFAKTDVSTVAYGGSVKLDFTVENLNGATLSSASVTEAPEGWSVDLAHATEAEPYITVTGPSRDAIVAGTAVGTGDIVITVKTSKNEDGVNVVKPVVRLYGINTHAEFIAFRDAYDPGSTGQNKPTLTGLDDYLVDGELTLNTDITFTNSDLHTYYLVKFLDFPLNGNSKTITMNLTGSGGILSFCQGLHQDVKNLYFDGSLTYSGTGECCFLSARGVNTNNKDNSTYLATDDKVTITNVHVKNTAVITYDRTSTSSALIGAIVSRSYDGNSLLVFRNCTSAATLKCTQGAPQAIGGMVGTDGNGVKTRTEFYDCSFSGIIDFKQTINKAGNIRLGGFTGDGARQSYYENCICSGTLKADMGGFVFNTSVRESGLGGFVGRTTATPPSGGHEMLIEFNNCEFKGSIVVTNLMAATTEYGWTAESYDSSATFGQIVGNKTPKAPSGLNTCQENGSISISFAE
ncbi:MAG: hypothetical protein IKX45_08005 [Bacteroidales bacterium]|nr:hypothetical protein [Bacteroidales bacterium]